MTVDQFVTKKGVMNTISAEQKNMADEMGGTLTITVIQDLLAKNGT